MDVLTQDSVAPMATSVYSLLAPVVAYSDAATSDWDDMNTESSPYMSPSQDGELDPEICFVSQSLARVPQARWRNFNYHTKYKCFGATAEMPLSEATFQQMTPCKFCVPVVPGGETFIALKRKSQQAALVARREDPPKTGKLSSSRSSSSSSKLSRSSPRETLSLDSSSDTQMDVDTPRSQYSDWSEISSYTPGESFSTPRERIQTLEEFFEIRIPVAPCTGRPFHTAAAQVQPRPPLRSSHGAYLGPEGQNSQPLQQQYNSYSAYESGYDNWDSYQRYPDYVSPRGAYSQ